VTFVLAARLVSASQAEAENVSAIGFNFWESVAVDHIRWRNESEFAMTRFELRRLTNYDDESLLAELRRVGDLVAAPWITKEEFANHSKASSGVIQRRFGSWKAALDRAGLGSRWSGREEFRNARIKISDRALVAELKRVAAILDGQPVTIEKFNEHARMNAETIRKRFGSWTKALNQADLAIANLGKRYTEEQYRENLLRVWTHYGRQPTYGEMSEPPSTIRARTYEAKWTTWRRALAAFIEYANAENDSSPILTSQILSEREIAVEDLGTEVRRAPESSRRKQPRPAEDQRTISLGLRFKVLHRDNFRCVLCGKNPPASPGLVLHVDHILPWSKGGKTEIGNLRTLCEPCNIGRGNRYSD
jgi:Homing endonuclease associated repeat/HNH endonuclease